MATSVVIIAPAESSGYSRSRRISRRSRGVPRCAELMQLERVVLGQHLAQFGQEQRVDHDAGAMKERPTDRPTLARLKDGAETMSIERIGRRVKGDACYNSLGS